ncbi:HD-GYP domain-containing protein [Zhaonella formicivorans]|uniref:HD-GYP domain-containing protein n=1 Tax=Zhaonella formicivorans TaxID=2528593 RepID=UPI0010D67B1A|nr:HD domain-containing phosphohydrolase [Zhaonella formicivorans]
MPATYSAFQVLTLPELFKEINFKADHLSPFKIREVIKLAWLIKQHHLSTFRHSLNVSRLAVLLAKKIGLTQNEVNEIALGALFHDLGKIEISPIILDKPGALNAEEWELVLRHPHFGVRILTRYKWSAGLLPIVAYHHERIDGHGYIGLCGNDIPIGAKIVCIADAFDAMNSPRPYRRTQTCEDCWAELEKNGGRQFDSDLVKHFINVTAQMLREVT